MKIITYFNYFLVGVSALLWGLGFIGVGDIYFYFGLLSTVLTGAYQLVTGIGLFLKNPKDKWIQIYLLVVILYFMFCYLLDEINYGISFDYVLFVIPIILALYFTVMLHIKFITKNSKG